MNRQIKFRVWDKYKKCWLGKSESLHLFSEYFLTLDGEIRRFDGAIPEMDGDEIFYTQSVESVFDTSNKKNWKPEDRFVIQQFIGLKDKNGKEIFEGDSLKWEYGLDNQKFSSVYWVSSNDDWDIDGWNIKESSSHHGGCEIVGNSCENPEQFVNNK